MFLVPSGWSSEDIKGVSNPPKINSSFPHHDLNLQSISTKLYYPNLFLCLTQNPISITMSPVTIAKNSAVVKGKSSPFPISHFLNWFAWLILTYILIYSFPRRWLRYHVNAVFSIQHPVSALHDVSMRPVKQIDHQFSKSLIASFIMARFWLFSPFFDFFRFIMMGCGRDVAGFRLFRLSPWNSLDSFSYPNYILRYHVLALFSLFVSLDIDQRNGLSQWIWMDGWIRSWGWKGRGGIAVNCLLFSHLEEKPPKKNTKKETLTTFLLNASLSLSLSVCDLRFLVLVFLLA